MPCGRAEEATKLSLRMSGKAGTVAAARTSTLPSVLEWSLLLLSHEGQIHDHNPFSGAPHSHSLNHTGKTHDVFSHIHKHTERERDRQLRGQTDRDTDGYINGDTDEMDTHTFTYTHPLRSTQLCNTLQPPSICRTGWAFAMTVLTFRHPLLTKE